MCLCVFCRKKRKKTDSASRSFILGLDTLKNGIAVLFFFAIPSKEKKNALFDDDTDFVFFFSLREEDDDCEKLQIHS